MKLLTKINTMDKIRLPKLHLACAKDALRPVMEHILITKDEIVATDAHILAILKTKDVFSDEFIAEMPERFLIHKSQWKDFYNGAFNFTFKDKAICVHYNGYEVLHKIKNEGDSIKYPNYDAFIPNQSDTKSLCEIGLNAFSLKTIVEALTFPYDVKTVKLQFFGANRAILVTPTNVDCNSRGIIMPAMITG